MLFQVVEQWAPNRGHSYDLLQAVSATAAEEFVSHDKRLRCLAETAGGGHPHVLGLDEFIRTLCRRVQRGI